MPTTLARRADPDVADHELVARCAERDPSALRHLYQRHSAAVYGCATVIAKRIGAPSAENLTAAAFLGLWRNPASAMANRRSIRAQLLIRVAHSQDEISHDNPTPAFNDVPVRALIG